MQLGAHSDPLDALPGGEVARATVGPYGFARGLDGIVPVVDAPPDGAVGRLAVCRALLDALLFGELTQRAELLDALVARDAWAEARALLEPAAEDPLVAQAQAEGTALLETLRARRMDSAYHGTVSRAARPGGTWEVEARLARLLDLEEVLMAGDRVPAEGRPQALAQILGATLPPCVGSAPTDGVEPDRADVVVLGHCGAEALGWPDTAEAQLYHPGLGAFTTAMGRGNEDLRAVLARSAHPLVADARGDIEALGGRLASLHVPIGLQIEAATDFPFELPTGRGDALDVRIFVLVAVGGQLRVGVPPLVSLGPSGARFVEDEAGLGFPGVVTPLEDLATRLEQAQTLLGTNGGPVVLVPGRLRVRSAAVALRAIRGALPLGARGEMVLGVYEPEVGLRGVGLRLATGSEPEGFVVDVAADGTVEWLEGGVEFLILRPDPELPLQGLLNALLEAERRVGTVLILL